MLTLLPELVEPPHLERGILTGAALIDLANVDFDEFVVLAKLQAATLDFYLRVPDAMSVDKVIQLLDVGTRCVVVSQNYADHLVSEGVTGDRIVVCTQDFAAAETLVGQGYWAGVVVPPTDADSINKLVDLAAKSVAKINYLVDVFVDGAESIYEKVPGAVPIISQEVLTIHPDQDTNKLSAAQVICSRLTSDRPDGLFTTIVTDTNHRALGVCYSSPESVKEAISTATGVYQSRKRGLWYKGASSGATQKLIRLSMDCDGDALEFMVEQAGPGFCHNNTTSCFGSFAGLAALEETVVQRMKNAPEGSYTKRLFTEQKLLPAKIMEEAEELCEAQSPEEVAWEAADLLYFATVKLAQSGVSWSDVAANLDLKSRKVTRRKGDAKPKWAEATKETKTKENQAPPTPTAPVQEPKVDESTPIHMGVIDGTNAAAVEASLRRPAQSSGVFDLAKPIVADVCARGDEALLELTAKFDKVQLKSPVLNAPFPPELMQVSDELKDAIDLAVANVEKFHAAQLGKDISVETAPGVVCSRFARPIARVGLYVPGGTAILPSTAIMLGVPAKVAGCKDIVFASPPRHDGTLTPEVVYIAHKVGASQIVLAGGAQAVAAMAYGTKSVTKCDKILGPGNQFVTAAKMIVQTDLNAQVSIDMPAGPSEVLVVADAKANKAFVVSDLLSQAEHGADSQVILIAVNYSSQDVLELQTELDKQARALSRVDVIRKSIAHSTILLTSSLEEAMKLSNKYAPEHLILQVENPSKLLPLVDNAGSVFVGALSPEACGDYTSGTNHTLPTYGYANQYSGVNTSTYLKHITSQELTPEGIASIGPATYALAMREGLDGHANAIKVRMDAFK